MLIVTAAGGQVVPTTPKKFAMRGVGSSATNTATGITQTKTEPVIRTTTYIVLAPSRQWTNSEGKPLVAKLIAFEDITTETTKSAAAANPTPQPSIPGKPTVISDGKIRLMADKKPYEVALAKLSQADQDFVAMVKRAVEAKK
jgi:hypothetical protein